MHVLAEPKQCHDYNGEFLAIAFKGVKWNFRPKTNFMGYMIVTSSRNCPLLSNLNVHHRVHRIPPLDPILSQINPTNTLELFHIHTIYFNL
jgi:hypothetical protein